MVRGIITSARKHGDTDEDILHAYRDNPAPFTMGDDKYMVVGLDTVGPLLEVPWSSPTPGSSTP